VERDPTNTKDAQPNTSRGQAPLPVVRSVVAGILMGLANLVPGVSGGTMILVMGLYDEFISSVADVTRLRFTKRNIAFLATVGCSALVAIAALAGTLSRAVTLHQSAMFSLFIGLTLGGAPLLARMIGRARVSAVVGAILGLAVMVAIAMTKEEPPDTEAVKAAVAAGEFVIEPNYGRDLAAGALGISAMVLPGISGAYMLLILGRYVPILASISVAKHYVLSLGDQGDPRVILEVILPTAIGAVLSLVLLSNLLKWLLHRHEHVTLGFLLGILLGSVIGIWPFDHTSDGGDYAVGAGLAVAGFLATFLLSRVGK